jgi:hypothetical protein
MYYMLGTVCYAESTKKKEQNRLSPCPQSLHSDEETIFKKSS